MFARLGLAILIATSFGILMPYWAVADEPWTGGNTPIAQKMAWKIEDATREAIVFVPEAAKSVKSPVVFGFHGHGGRAAHGTEKFGFEKLWPEAIVVYMQGLPTPGKNDPEGNRNGWQKDVGDQGDRDLKFFDAVLTDLQKEYQVDDQRIYAAGHSNGGGFTYLLWTERPQTFAALAPSAGGFRRPRTPRQPVPILHIAGRNDATVPFTNQERTMTIVRSINGCGPSEGKALEGNEWARGCLLFESEKGAPFVSYVHDETHKYPDEAPALIVKFFQEHQKK